MNRHPNHDEAVRLARQGLTGAQIRELTGVSTRQLSKIRVRYGISAPRPRKQPDWDLIESRLDDGWPFREITRTYGVSWETLNARFPGRAWSKAQVGSFTRMRMLEERTLGRTG